MGATVDELEWSKYWNNDFYSNCILKSVAAILILFARVAPKVMPGKCMLKSHRNMLNLAHTKDWKTKSNNIRLKIIRLWFTCIGVCSEIQIMILDILKLAI